jgi:hypothetical protein
VAIKTQPTKLSVTEFINSVDDEQKRKDAKTLLKLMKDTTGEKPMMWGTSIIGFGSYHYKSDRSRQEGDWPLTGFSPRKQNMTVYIMPGFEQYDALMKKLGKYKTGKSCLYFKQLEDIDEGVLRELVSESYQLMKKVHGK